MEMDGLYLLVLFDFQNCLLNGVSILFFYLKSFPEELFSVLRTIQLLRGLTVGMGLRFSCAQQWKPIAEEALLKSGRLKGNFTSSCLISLYHIWRHIILYK